MAYSKEQHLQEREYQQHENNEREILQKHYGLNEVNGTARDKKVKTKKQKL